MGVRDEALASKVLFHAPAVGTGPDGEQLQNPTSKRRLHDYDAVLMNVHDEVHFSSVIIWLGSDGRRALQQATGAVARPACRQTRMSVPLFQTLIKCQPPCPGCSPGACAPEHAAAGQPWITRVE
jgi:hypothetical protein